jgi:glyoxylase-like metal-dependent hydrolase (beta-lactamase superfamily II)
MDRLWGPIIPVPEKHITPVHDGDVIEVGGLRITAIETPGHARHHHAFALDDICFVGDIAGITVPGIAPPPRGKFIAVPTPPPEFDLQAWHASVKNLQSRNFREIYPTHFGKCDHPAPHFQRLNTLVTENAEFVRRGLEDNFTRDEILARYIAWIKAELHAEGIGEQDRARYASTNLLTMNVDGMIRYWTRLTGNVGRSIGVR